MSSVKTKTTKRSRDTQWSYKYKKIIYLLVTDRRAKNDNHLRLDSLCEFKLKLWILSTAAQRSWIIAQCPQLKRRQQNVREIHNEVINIRKSYIYWLQTDAQRMITIYDLIHCVNLNWNCEFWAQRPSVHELKLQSVQELKITKN